MTIEKLLVDGEMYLPGEIAEIYGDLIIYDAQTIGFLCKSNVIKNRIVQRRRVILAEDFYEFLEMIEQKKKK
jgi:hypothetical protein